MSDSGRWWLPITVGAVAAVTAFQIITRSEIEATEELDTHLTVPEEQSSPNDKPLKFEESNDDTEIDNPVSSSIVRDSVNADTMLDESYYDISPKLSPIEKVDNAWKLWGRFFSP